MRMRREDGFSMIGIVIAIAVIGMLLAAILPRTLKSKFLDIQLAEVSRMAALHEALNSYVIASHVVPGAATWAQAISQYASESPAQIVVSGMNQQVIYVYPDNFIATASTLPYDQVANATAGSFLNAAPVNPRVMIISNLGQTPLATASGQMPAATFDAVWNQAGTFPAELTEGDALKIERVNLGGLFFPVTLNNNDAATSSSYTVDAQPNPPAALTPLSTTTLHLIKSTKLDLYDGTGTIYYRHTVSEPTSFVFNGGVWGSTLGGAGGGGTGGGGGGGGAGVGPIFDPNQGGLLTNWGADPTCTPTGTPYSLTVINNTPKDTYWVYGGVGGVPTTLGKVKKNSTKAFQINECELYLVVPEVKGNNAPVVYAGYMPHNNLTVTVP